MSYASSQGQSFSLESGLVIVASLLPIALSVYFSHQENREIRARIEKRDKHRSAYQSRVESTREQSRKRRQTPSGSPVQGSGDKCGAAELGGKSGSNGSFAGGTVAEGPGQESQGVVELEKIEETQLEQLSASFESDLSEIKEQIVEDLDLLGRVSIDQSSGSICETDFSRIFKLVNKYIIRVPLVRQKVMERREALQQGDDQAYCLIVPQVLELEEAITNEVRQCVYNHYKIDEDMFMLSYENLFQNEELYHRTQFEVCQMKVQARVRLAERLEQGGASPRDVVRVMPRELTQAQAYQIYFRELEIKQSYQADLIQTQQNEEQLNWKKIIFDALIQDRINNEFNIEPEDFTIAVQRYNLISDPEVINRQNQYENLTQELCDKFMMNGQNSGCEENLTNSDQEEMERTLKTLNNLEDDDLNDRDATLNLQSAEQITNSLLDIDNTGIEHYIGDQHLSKIFKQPESGVRISVPVPKLPTSLFEVSVSNSFVNN